MLMTKRKHTKKVLVTDEKSTPQARAARLKRLRNLANLSRKEMCEGCDININTLKGWEIARYGGLPLDGAEKVVARVAEEGVTCTLDWLLYEIGIGPQLVTGVTDVGEAEKASHEPRSLEEDESRILEEILLFRKHYKDTIDYAIEDDGMAPHYQVGDYVAGVKHYGEAMHSLIGRDCIVQSREGRVYLRKLREGTESGRFTLMCSNMQTSIKTPVIYNVELAFAAPVIRYFRKAVSSR